MASGKKIILDVDTGTDDAQVHIFCITFKKEEKRKRKIEMIRKKKYYEVGKMKKKERKLHGSEGNENTST